MSPLLSANRLRRLPALMILAPALAALSPAPSHAFDARLWASETRETGTTFFQCKASECGGTNVVASFHGQDPTWMPNYAAFLKYAASISQARLTKGVKSQALIAQDDSKSGGRHYFVLDQITYPNGQIGYFASGFAAVGLRGWSLGVSGPTKEIVAGTYDELVAHVRGLK